MAKKTGRKLDLSFNFGANVRPKAAARTGGKKKAGGRGNAWRAYVKGKK
jgi:hypothetical protein